VFIVTLQEYITIQLGLLGVIACTVTTFKLVFKLYLSKRFLVVIVCEIIFEVIIILRIKDYYFYLEITGQGYLDE
jgi:hypothetical protein